MNEREQSRNEYIKSQDRVIKEREQERIDKLNATPARQLGNNLSNDVLDKLNMLKKTLK